MKRRTLRHLRPKRQPEQHHNVYVVLLDPAGKVLATIPGGTFTGVRLTPEIPGDFYDFQKNQ